MSFNFSSIEERIRIKNNTIKVKVMVISGKEVDHFIVVSPSLMVSGYGDTEDEAKASFEENMHTFCEDLHTLSSDMREKELSKLGFKQQLYAHKNFSKSYVDENGVLQGLEPGTVKSRMLEAVI